MNMRQGVVLCVGAVICLLVAALFWLSYMANPTTNKYVYIWQVYYWPGRLPRFKHFTGNRCDYYPDGTVRMSGGMKKGRMDGICTTYYQDGTIASRSEYRDDYPVEGTTVEWHHYPDMISYCDEVREREVLEWMYDNTGRCMSMDWRQVRESPDSYHPPSGIWMRYEPALSTYIIRIQVDGKEFFMSDDLTAPECKAVIGRALPLLDPFYQDIFRKQFDAAMAAPKTDEDATIVIPETGEAIPLEMEETRGDDADGVSTDKPDMQ